MMGEERGEGGGGSYIYISLSTTSPFNLFVYLNIYPSCFSEAAVPQRRRKKKERKK